MKTMTPVTTAAGKTGFATAMQLLKKSYPVRAFVHRLKKSTRHKGEISDAGH